MTRSLALKIAPPLLFGVLVPTAALAAWPHEATINLPVCTATNTQVVSSLIPDGAGGAFVTWQDYRAGNSDVYAQHILASGIVDPNWPANGRAVCTQVAEQYNPVLVADGVGGIIVIWSDFRPAPGVADIYAQHVLANGQIDPAWPATQLPVCTAIDSQQLPLAVSDGQGGAIVTWQDFRTLDFDLYCQRVRLSGSVDPAWPANGRALCTATTTQEAPAVLSDGAGGMIVAWYDSRNGNPDIYAHRMLASGVVDPAWPVNGRAVCTATGPQTGVVCATDGAGGAILAWADERVAQDPDIYAHHISSSGVLDVKWSATGLGVCTDAADQFTPCIAEDGAGGAIVAWRDARLSRIFAMRVTASGLNDPAWTNNGIVLTSDGGVTQDDPVCISDGAGGAFVTYSEFHTFGGSEIYAQHVLGNGSSDYFWPGAGLPVSTQPSTQTNPFIVSDGKGGSLIAWNDVRTPPNFDVYAQRIAPFGKLGNPEGTLFSVRDVPNDQGGQVLLEWTASHLDGYPLFFIDHYSVWRRVAAASTAEMNARAATTVSRPWRTTLDGVTTTYWEWIAEQPARGRPGYSCVVPTTSDSNSLANPLTEFLVSAEYSSGVPYWDSAPLSGYSVDNLPPATPSPFTGQYAAGTATLQWGANHEADFLEYRLYRGGSPNFVPASFTLVTSQSGTGYTDPAGAGFYYKLAAVDIHGNASAYALLLPSGATVDATPNPVAAFALSPPTPNPARDWTEMRLALPRAAHVSLGLHDAAGRLVRTVLSEDLGSGEHPVRVPLVRGDGRALPAGLYFLRLEAGPLLRTARLVVIR